MPEITDLEFKKLLLRSQKDPIFFCEEVLGVKTLGWPQHREALMSFVDNDVVAIKSGHSLGKDFLSGLISLWFLYCFYPSVVITTAPSARQVQKIIWGEISKYWNGSKYPLGGTLKTQAIDISDDWYAIGFTTKETNQMIGKFQGFKGANILVVVTEAQAVEDNIYEQIDGVMTANNSKLYMAGNPLMNTGEFARAFTRKNVKKFTWSCYDSPNYIQNKEVIPGMVGRKWVEDKEKKWGKGSPLFQARVLGEFPKQSIYSLISLDECMKAVDVESPQKGRKVLSGDIARYGDDSTVITVLNGGDMIDQVEQQGKPTTQTEGLAVNLIVKHDPQDVVMDEGAMGAGVVDHLEESQKEIKSKHGIEYDLYGFNFGGKAEDSKFANKGTEAWFYGCEAIKKGKVRLMDDPELFSQLSSRKYEFSPETGKIRLVSKETMKKKGLPSPDKADALMMGLYLSLETQTDYGDGEEDTSYLEAQIDPRTGYINARDPYKGGVRG